MSFGAMTAWQALLLIAAAGGAAAAIFFVKVRPPRIAVPSLLLWRRVLDHSREMTWWERVRRAVSLAVTVLIAVALALALTRPGPRASGSAGGGRMLIVIDSSWSMAAKTAGSATRWQRALAQAHALAASASGEVALATTGDGLVEAPTSDVALIDTAIDGLTPSGGETADFPRVAGIDAVHFITDGAVGRALDKSVVVHSVFEAVPNVAVTALELRPATDAGSAGEAYIEIANYATTAQAVRLTIARGNTTVLDTSTDMGAGEVARRSAPLDLEGDPELHVRVSAPANRLAEDDEAVAFIGGAAPILVALVSDQPAALNAVLRTAPGIRTAVVSPSVYRPGREDVAVFDRWLPPTAPGKPFLCIAPPAAAWFGTVGPEESTPRWTTAADHPVLAGVDPTTFELKHARAYQGEGLEVLARSEAGTPIVAVSDREDRRIALLTFAPADVNLTSAPSLPVLIDNALEWLARPVTDAARRPGAIVLPAGTTRVTSPARQAIPLGRVGASSIARLSQPGFYGIEAGGARATVGVNVGSPDVSNLLRTTVPASAATHASAGAGYPWWLYAMLAAFALLTAEWWTWQRRLTV